MDDTAKTDVVLALAGLVDDHKGSETLVLDLRDSCSWTEYFIITTTSSQAHVKGLYKHVRSFLSSQDIEILHRQKNFQEEGWILLDCGFMVIHFMSEETRSFYELEKLWHNGSVLYHSSKSS